MSGDVKPIQAANAAALQRLPAATKSASSSDAKAASPTAPSSKSSAPKLVPVEGGDMLEFSVEPSTSQLVVKLVDGTTSEVIRKIPAETVQEVVNQVRGVSGLMIDETS